MLATGKLRKRVVLKRATVSQDTYGQQVRTMVTVATVWAELSPTSGRQFYAAGQKQSEVAYVVTIRHRADMQAHPNWEVHYGARVFKVNAAVNVDERNEELRLFCTEEL